MSKPTLLFYCQHSLGIGHLKRSLALAKALDRLFRVVFLSGGRLPRKIAIPERLALVPLPPVGLDEDGDLISLDRRRTLHSAQKVRAETILRTFDHFRPQAVLIELFPFGRKRFAGELLPLLEKARDPARGRPLVVCSLRDILVSKGDRQAAHDERARDIANRFFDAILVHSDPRFVRIEETFGLRASLRVPVFYTGFACDTSDGNGLPAAVSVSSRLTGPASRKGASPRTTPPLARSPMPRILVSAGGGRIGEALLRAAVEAQALLYPKHRLRMKVITGPFLPQRACRSLRALARRTRGVELRRWVPDLCAEMRASAASISQCGYNTTLDFLRSQVPALVVPYGEGLEDEQANRARRLERLGAVRVLAPGRLTGKTLAAEIERLLHFRPKGVALDFDGARTSAELVAKLVRKRTGRRTSRGAPGSRAEKGARR